jgi:hypothetical protein
MNDTIYAAMSRVSDAVRYIQKRGHNSHQKYSYVMAADISDVFHREFQRQGIVFLPSVAGHSSELHGEKGYLVTLKLDVVFALASNPESRILTSSIGQGYDSTDKGANKAYTAAIKNCLIHTFLVPSGEDSERDEDGQKLDVEAIVASFEEMFDSLKDNEPRKGQHKETYSTILAGFRTLSKRPVEHPGEFASRADAAACLAALRQVDAMWRKEKLRSESGAGQAQERASEVFKGRKAKGQVLTDDQKLDLHSMATELYGDDASMRLAEVLTANGYASLDDVPATAAKAIALALEALK